MRTATLTTLLLFQLTVFGQGPRQKKLLDKVLLELRDLKKKNIDSVIYFMPYFVGDVKSMTITLTETEEEIRNKECEISDVVFLVWQKRGTTYAKKLNECWRFKTVMVDSLDFIRQFNKSTCKDSTKSYEFIAEDKSIITTGIDHSEVWDLYANIGNIECTQSIDCFNLLENKGEDKEVNINFKYNNELPLIKMLTKLNRQLYNIHFEKE